MHKVNQRFPKSKRRRKSGAARTGKNHGAPPWLWLVTGVAVGLFASFLFHLATTPRGHHAAVAATAKPAKHAAGTNGHSSRHGPKFDFYTLLPDSEVIVPDEGEGSAKKPAAAKPNTIYYLQAGSFRKAKQADHRRARLILLGLDAHVDKVNSGGETWYRVQAGPYESHDKVSDARNKLIDKGIDTLVLSKRKGE